MKIDLEKHIRGNRSELDHVDKININEMWLEFNENKRSKIKRNKPINYKFYWAAACAILLIGLTTIFNSAGTQTPDQMIQERMALADPTLAKEQISLVKMIKNQGEIMGQLGIDESQFPDLFQELKVLDSLQVEAMNDLESFADRKNLWRTLLRNYKNKARVLELMIYEFDKQENEIRNENELQI